MRHQGRSHGVSRRAEKILSQAQGPMAFESRLPPESIALSGHRRNDMAQFRFFGSMTSVFLLTYLKTNAKPRNTRPSTQGRWQSRNNPQPASADTGLLALKWSALHG